MALRPVALPAGVPGTLWLSSMPGRSGPWTVFETEARRAGLTLVVCLTPRDEVAELSPAYDAAVAQGGMPFRWLHLPLPNFGVPQDQGEFRREIAGIADAVRGGEAVMLHCAAGLGRTGTAAACVLKALGASHADALERVRQAGSNPQNALQSGLVDWF
jgi:protein-tyrosine phosphatase